MDLSDAANSTTGGISDLLIAQHMSWSTQPNIAIFFDTCRNVIRHDNYDSSAYKAYRRIRQNFVGWMAYTANVKDATEYAFEFPIDHLKNPDDDDVKSCSTRKAGADGAGAFTWAVLLGLRGLADGAFVESRKDEKVDAEELIEYVERKVSGEICRTQRPDANDEVRSRGEELLLSVD